MSTDDQQDQSEEFDGNVLGERHTDDTLPGANFPPDQPLGVEDPTVTEGGSEARDDVATRDWRHQGEDQAAPPGGHDDPPERITSAEH